MITYMPMDELEGALARFMKKERPLNQGQEMLFHFLKDDPEALFHLFLHMMPTGMQARAFFRKCGLEEKWKKDSDPCQECQEAGTVDGKVCTKCLGMGRRLKPKEKKLVDDILNTFYPPKNNN